MSTGADGGQAPETPPELVVRAQQGDREAISELIKANERRLVILLHVKMGPALRAWYGIDDAYQETYVEVLKSISKFRWQGPESFFRWLGGIAEHVILKFSRKVRRLPEPVEGFSSSDGRPELRGALVDPRAVSPTRALAREERLARFEAAFLQLSEDHQRAFYLAHLRLLPSKEIAELMERTPEAVAMLLVRARREFRSHFGGPPSSLGLPAGGPWRLPGGGDAVPGAAQQESAPHRQLPSETNSVGAVHGDAVQGIGIGAKHDVRQHEGNS